MFRILRGLYAITSEAICTDDARLFSSVEAALTGGARMIQYRDKQANDATRRRRATPLLALCRQHRARLIINDDIDLAASCGADGVHLGRSDAPLAQARKQLGPDAIIGASCGNSFEHARLAANAGASYIAFGRFFASRTKPEAPPADLELLMQAKTLNVSRCAIGGITPDNAPAVIAAGADWVAAVEGVFGAADIEAAARQYQKLFL